MKSVRIVTLGAFVRCVVASNGSFEGGSRDASDGCEVWKGPMPVREYSDTITERRPAAHEAEVEIDDVRAADSDG